MFLPEDFFDPNSLEQVLAMFKNFTVCSSGEPVPAISDAPGKKLYQYPLPNAPHTSGTPEIRGIQKQHALGGC